MHGCPLIISLSFFSNHPSPTFLTDFLEILSATGTVLYKFLVSPKRNWEQNPIFTEFMLICDVIRKRK